MSQAQRPLLVVGAGIAGVTAALEAAEAGQPVVLVEKDPSVGGRVLKNHQYFPKLCPPSCGMEINTRRLSKSPLVRVLVRSQVTAAERDAAGWRVTVRRSAEHVTDACTACGDCSAACPVSVPDPFNLGLGQVKAIRLPHLDAWPRRFVMDRQACPDGCRACADACKVPGAIDLQARDRDETIEAGAVVLATGWNPYPIEKLTELGGGRLPDVVSNVVMERLAAPSGPTAGKILRPSDGAPPRRVAFIQCAGSRDVKHLPYCSAVCCMVSTKQAMYVKAQLPEAEVTVYYIDRRTPGRNESMLPKAEAAGVRFVKGKVATVNQAGGALVLHVEDVDQGRIVDAEADLVVLAIGMVPARNGEVPLPLGRDGDGFVGDDRAARLFAAGVARRPEDVAASVRDATGAAAKALCAARSA
ncbi:MAG TPA: FAD-dependent oxidoreductase [Anaeromyxobacteraceae bacterium]|nr:FAD-dependent oxidoreductase [Anaeromyxobacteraceae bacterium]